jgi:lanthanide-dependent methanol dehydrogenase
MRLSTRAPLRFAMGALLMSGSMIVAAISLAPPAEAQGNNGNQQSTASGGSSQDLLQMEKDPNQWVMASHDYANVRYSALDQINTNNASHLQVAWTFSDGVAKGQEAAPLVIGDTMYLIAPYAGPHPNEVFALDAATGDLKWSYSPKPDLSAQGVACCDVVTRGIAYDNGKIFLNTLDDYSVALDAKTGKELWHTKLGDINKGETVTMAPLVVKGKVLVGNSGGELGVRGWLTAVDENTGKIAWRAYNTGPDSDVLIGPDFKPFYTELKGKDLGVTTWPPDAWKIGGATVWGWLQYDPDLNLIYYGTSNPGTWNANQRPGDNLWSDALFARDPDTGAAKWAVQLTQHDWFDYDEIPESLLLDLPIDGKTRKVLVHPARNGYMYVIDRVTGEILSADPFGPVNATKGVDLKTGRTIPNMALEPKLGKTIVDICPASIGMKDWQPTAYSPKTGLIYVPHQNTCENWKSSNVAYIAGTPYVGAIVDMYSASADGHRGEFGAWDPVKRKYAWRDDEKFPVWTGTVATAGDVVFYGTMDRWFKAVDAKSGKLLYQFRGPSGFIGQPITYSVKGKQYVAILSGVGGWTGAVANSAMNPRLRNGALGASGGFQDLPGYTAGGGTLLVFALPATEASGTGSQTNTGPGTPGNGEHKNGG